MIDVASLVAVLPEPWRTYVNAALQALAVAVMVSSVITANTPAWAFKRWRALRIFSRLSALAPRDGAGTMKVPGFAPRNPGAAEELARLRAFDAQVKRVAPEVVAALSQPKETK